MWIPEFRNYFRLEDGQLQFIPSLDGEKIKCAFCGKEEFGWDDVEEEFYGWDVVMQVLGA